MKFFKALLAFLAAALTPATAYATIYYFNTPIGSTVSRSDALHYSIQFGAIAFVVAFTDLVVFGIPAFFLAMYLEAVRWWTTLLAAFVVGATPYAVFVWTPNRSIISLSSYFYGITAFGLFGLSGGLVFWLLWRYWVLSVPARPEPPVVESRDKD
jgi:hypothetical protein